MNHPHTTLRSAPALTSARGFTLIEVMLAVVILGLGVLGLAALFAGAAGQQQRSNEINLSVGLARNAEALLTRNLGRLAGSGLIRLIERDGADGWWFEATASSVDWSLTLDPREDGSLFFLVDVNQPRVIFESDRAQDMPPSDGFGANNSTAGAVFDSMQPFADARVHPDNIQIVIETWRRNASNEPEPSTVYTFAGPDLTEDDVFRMPALQRVVLPDVNGDPPMGISLNPDFSEPLSQATDTSNNFSNFALVDLASRPTSPTDAAFIEFYLGDLDPINEWVERVTVLSYTWRNARLVSLNDRFIFEDDARFAGGRRPVMGYTALLRTINNGSASQLTIFTYSLSPLAIPRSNTENRPFIPPERYTDYQQDNGVGLLRKYEGVELRYDTDREQYYIQVSATGTNPAARRDRHITNPSQILMMINSEGVNLGDTAGSGLDDGRTPGSDIPVRVIAQQRVGDDLRGYLDRSPRVNGRSPLRTLTDTSAVQVDFWGFNETVQSLTSDRTEWSIRPVEARQFQLVFDN